MFKIFRSWAKSDDDNFITGFGNWMFTKTFNILYKQKITDVSCII